MIYNPEIIEKLEKKITFEDFGRNKRGGGGR
jgi:hypothetical protein